MVKVLVIGATGYIGEAVAIELRRRGHEVYGLVRDRSKAKDLILKEVQVVIGNATEAASMEEAVKKVDVVINTAVNFQDPSFEEPSFRAISAAIQSAGGRKRFILSSGTAVYKSSNEPITEDSPIRFFEKDSTNLFVKILQPRLLAEKETLASKAWDGVVIRPPSVYGGKKIRYTRCFEEAETKGKLTVHGTGENLLGHVHIDDLAEAYARVVEADVNAVRGEVFHFAEPDRISQKDIAIAFAKVVGKENVEIEHEPWLNPFFADVSGWLDSSKAKRVLGWTPGHNLIRDAKLAYLAWKESGTPATW